MSTSVPVERFGGLNLAGDPSEVGLEGAVDLLNVDVDSSGRVKNRGGYTVVKTGGSWLRFSAIHVTDGTDTLAINLATGATVATAAGTAFLDARTYGTPAFTRNYLTTSGAPLYYDAPTFTTWSTTTVDGVAGRNTPRCRAVGVTPKDNRLVLANGLTSTSGPNGSASSDSHVHFSDALTPDAWTTNSYVQLAPGDGGQIREIVNFRDVMIVFKDRKFFTFGETATDGAGLPRFYFREVNVGQGVTGTSDVTVGPNGVYFIGSDGIYVTTGDQPVLISQAIEPLWTNEFSNASALTAPTSFDGLVYWRGSLYLTCNPAGLTRTFVYDIASQAWSMYSGIDVSRVSISPAAAFLYFFSGTSIYKHLPDDTYTTDNGAAISGSYTSGLSSLGGETMKRMREALLWGYGSPTFQVATDFGAVDTGGAVTLGTFPAVARGVQRTSRRGRLYGYKLSGSGQWSVSRLALNIADARVTS